MKTNGQIINVTDCHVDTGDFNRGEHLRVKIEAGKVQTISCELPDSSADGKTAFVTFSFIPSQKGIECVDIHTTHGGAKPRGDDRGVCYPQHLLGFSKGGDVFDTRKANKICTLATLLLGSHYATK